MVCLGFKPGAAGWYSKTNPLNYGSTPMRSIHLVACVKVALGDEDELSALCKDVDIYPFCISLSYAKYLTEEII